MKYNHPRCGDSDPAETTAPKTHFLELHHCSFSTVPLGPKKYWYLTMFSSYLQTILSFNKSSVPRICFRPCSSQMQHFCTYVTHQFNKSDTQIWSNCIHRDQAAFPSIPRVRLGVRFQEK